MRSIYIGSGAFVRRGLKPGFLLWLEAEAEASAYLQACKIKSKSKKKQVLRCAQNDNVALGMTSKFAGWNATAKFSLRGRMIFGDAICAMERFDEFVRTVRDAMRRLFRTRFTCFQQSRHRAKVHGQRGYQVAVESKR